MQLDFALPNQMQFESPYLADYFGIWQVHEQAFRSMVERCQGMNLHAHVRSEAVAKQVADADNRDYELTGDGIAVFQLRGVMMKSVPSMSNGTSTVRLRQAINQARRDSQVKGGMVVGDTPGGTVKGNSDLASAFASFSQVKPLYFFVEDMTASAGVSVASQATKRFANDARALYGSMGTYTVIEDLSGMAEQLGVKVHVIRAGEYKGMGEPGSEVEEKHLAEAQRIVDSLNDGYLETIAKGTGQSIDGVKAVADGRIILASDAVSLGLLDGVQSYEQTYAQLVAAANPRTVTSNSKPPKSEIPKMNDPATPASLAELKQTFPNSTADWRETQMEAGATLPIAAVAYAQHVEAKATAERAEHAKELADAKAAAEKAANTGRNSVGHDPVLAGNSATGDDLEETGDPTEDFHAEVAKIAGPNPDMKRRQSAIRTVATRKPELYRAYLLSINPGQRQSRLINEKLESVGAK
jgi:signal peptide peptidase SppA